MAQVIGFTLQINGVQTAIQTQQQLVDVLRKTNAELARAQIGSDEYRRLQQEVATLRNAQNSLTQSTRAAQNAQQIAADQGRNSYRALNAELITLRQRYRDLSETDRNSQIGQSSLARIRQLDTELRRIDAQMGQFQRNVGNYQSAIAGFGSGAVNAIGFGFLAGGAAAIGEAVVDAAKKIIDLNVKISEAQADVVKTSGLSQASVEQLTESLKGLDTRTTLDELLGVGAALGELGVEVSTRTINATDKLAVALKGELSDSAKDVAKEIGILRNVLTDFKTNDVSDDFLKIGNALNVLGATGAATADKVADFATRIAPSIALGLRTDEIFGISAALQELGVTAERGASGVNRIFRGITANPELFSKILNIPIKEFTKLIENDLGAAFNLVVKKVTETSKTNIELSKTLKALKIDGEGEIEVFNKLAGNADLLSQRIKTSGEALKDTSSILTEFTAKNETLGAVWRRVWNSITESTVSAGLTNGLKSLGNFLNDLINSESKFAGVKTSSLAVYGKAGVAIQNESEKLKKLVGDINDTNTSSGLRKRLIDDLIKLQPDLAAGIDKTGVSEEKLNFILAEGNRQYTIRKELAKKDVQLEGLDASIREKEERLNDIKSKIDAGGFGVDKKRSLELLKQDFDRQLELYNGLIDKRNDLISNRAFVQGSLTVNEANKAIAESYKTRFNKPENADPSNGSATESAKKLSKVLKDEVVKNSIKYFEQEIAKFKAKLDNTKTSDIETQKNYGKTIDELTDKLNQAKKIRDEILRVDLVAPELIPTTTKASTFNSVSEVSKILVGDKIEKQTLESTGDLLQKQFDLQIAAVTEQEAERFKILEESFKKQLGAAEGNKALQLQIFNDFEKEKTVIALQADIEREKLMLGNFAENSEERLELTKSILDKENQLRDFSAQKEQERLERQKRNFYAFSKVFVDGLQQIADFEDSLTQKKINRLEKDYKNRIELADGNAQRQKELEKELDDEKIKIAEEAFNRNKAYSIATALINGALAVTRVLSDTIDPTGIYKAILVAGTIASTVAQVAVISNQEFVGEKGLFFERQKERHDTIQSGMLTGASHTNGGLKGVLGGNNVELEGGEFVDSDVFGNTYVINKRSSAAFSYDLKNQQGESYAGKQEFLSRVNSFQNYGKKFAEGGIAQTAAFRPRASESRNLSQDLKLTVTIDENSINQIGKATFKGTYKGSEVAINKSNLENQRAAQLASKTKK